MDEILLCDNNSCTQCRACEAVCPRQCIRFVVGKDGFVIPFVDEELCIKCGLCMKSCHQLNFTFGKHQPRKSYAAWSKDDSTRRKSSSGGIFTEIAQYVFSRDGVVVGAVMNKQLKVQHAFAETPEQLIPMRGSKYVQSDIEGLYAKTKDYLNLGRYVFFTGTPCQVAGLYSFLKKDYDKLLTCDLVCHGVPSQKSFDAYCGRVGLIDGKTEEVRFRYTEGWGLQMATRSHLNSPCKDGDFKWKNISPRKSYFLRAFTSGLMFSEACYSCHYATPQRVSDFTLADYWGIGTESPFNHPTNKGVSLLLANTEKAETVIAACETMFVEERPLSEAIQGNHNLSKCSSRPKGRDTYFKDAEEMPIGQLMKKYGLAPTIKDYLRPLKRKLIQ